MKSAPTTPVDSFELILDRARVLLKTFPAFGEISAMSELIKLGVSPSISFFAIRGAQVLELQLAQTHLHIKK